VDSDCRIFQEKWTDEYFYVYMNGKTLCLICSKSMATLKEYNIARHYTSKHKEKYKNCVSTLRREKVGLESQQNVFRKQFIDSAIGLSGKRNSFWRCKFVSCNSDELNILVVTYLINSETKQDNVKPFV
jgi:hypothetical protein